METASRARRLRGALEIMLVNRVFHQLFNRVSTRLRCRRILESFDSQHPAVFVLSTGRAGTKTLSALLGLAHNVLAYHEPTPKLYNLSRLSYEKLPAQPLEEVFQEAFLLARNGNLRHSLCRRKGYVETSPQVTFLGPVIARAIPRVSFIHLVRDPRDVVRSGMRRGWYRGHPYDATRIRPREGSGAHRDWRSYDAFRKNLWLWTETNRWIIRFRRETDSAVYPLRAEDVFDSNRDVINSLFSFIGSSVPPQRHITRILGRKLNAQRTGSFPEYSDWSDQMCQTLVKVAGEVAAQVGYDLG